MRIAILILLCASAMASTQLVSVEMTVEQGVRHWKLSAGLQSDAVAWANYTNALTSTGWTFFHGEVRSTAPLADAAFGLGYAEGFVTQDLIYAAFKNFAATFYQNATAPSMRI